MDRVPFFGGALFVYLGRSSRLFNRAILAEMTPIKEHFTFKGPFDLPSPARTNFSVKQVLFFLSLARREKSTL